VAHAIDEPAGSAWLRGAPARWDGDAEALAGALRERLRGEVGFDPGSRALYATDGSNYRQVPVGVVWPKDAEDVERTVATCREAGAPILGRGGGTSLAGQCCNVAVVMDMSRHMGAVLEVDPSHALARVQPGCVLDDLRGAANAYDLTFGPDPSTHTHCTLGGMIGNNSCGVHAVMAGRTADNVEALEVLLYDGSRMHVGATGEEELARIVAEGGRRGEIYRRLRELRDRYADAIRRGFPRIPRRVSGYNLDELLPERGFQVARALVGSEGTCATTLEATLRLVRWPRHRVLAVLGFDDAYVAADHVLEVLEHGPMGLEGLDRRLMDDMRTKGMKPRDLALLSEGEGNGWLLVEFGGETREEARGRADRMARALGRRALRSARIFDDPEQQKKIWEIRESGLGATARVPGQGDTWPGWEDSAVAPERMGDYMRELRALFEKYGYHGAFYGHFGDGCLHTRIDFDLETRRGVETYRAFVEEAADLCVRFGGSLSGEHGDGQSRAELLPRMYGDELCRAFQEFKEIWDPDHRMNPGKAASGPYPILSDLRLGEHFRPWEPQTHFAFTRDQGAFHRATLRCVGVGKCRATSSGIMCPSYMVTREERHSTRGRAHLLFEMLRGEELEGGWRSEPVKEALDLCLACKGCKSECPVSVDMATYKAEFLSHYYRRRLRPRTAYSMGLVYWWARAASVAPWAANFAAHAPGLSRVLKAVGGIAPERRMPRFARRSFRRSFREGEDRDRPPVMLFPDTFNGFFFPDTLHAGARVLGAAGRHVRIPRRILCCGRPLYDFGMLDLAKRQLRQILDVLSPEIQAGVPLVGLEPSCVATFRDELGELFPRDLNAMRLRAQTCTLAEYLREIGFEPPRALSGPALVQRHCHHASVMGFDDDEALLSGTGLEPEVLDSGCCGMAGSFGFEAGAKYEVSRKAGERVLAPAIREAGPDAWIVADGFSCREQVAQATGRRAWHLAEVLDRSLRG
jgi:FAD/FMN-containing dehydrogenase/Fe-S oxidoreductase